MYYNVKKLTAVIAQLNVIISEENVRLKGNTWHTTEYKTDDVRKIFESQTIDYKDDFSKQKMYSWDTWNVEDFEVCVERLNKLLIKHQHIEDTQSIPDSVIDDFIEASRDAEIGTIKFMYGDLSNKDQNIMRDVSRKVHEYTKIRKYE